MIELGNQLTIAQLRLQLDTPASLVRLAAAIRIVSMRLEQDNTELSCFCVPTDSVLRVSLGGVEAVSMVERDQLASALIELARALI